MDWEKELDDSLLPGIGKYLGPSPLLYGLRKAGLVEGNKQGYTKVANGYKTEIWVRVDVTIFKA